MPIAAFALFLALPLWAQHGGGHAGGGHGMGFSGGRGGFGGGHSSGGMRSGPASRGFSHGSSFARRSFTQRSFSHRGFSNRSFSNRSVANNRFRSRRGRNFGVRSFCNGFGCRARSFYPFYPWAYAGYYDPYWWWDSSSSYDEDYERDRQIANEMNQQSLEEQRMRERDRDNADQDLYASSRQSPAHAESDPLEPATVLVFRDQRRQEVRNYAIVGNTLWTFAPQRTQKIPLAAIDLVATTKANDDRGLSFRVPVQNEVQ